MTTMEQKCRNVKYHGRNCANYGVLYENWRKKCSNVAYKTVAIAQTPAEDENICPECPAE